MRLTTIGIPCFQHDGLVVTGNTWSHFDYATADPKAQDAFRTYTGSHVRIHPEDVGELAGLGLALRAGRIVETKARAKPR